MSSSPRFTRGTSVIAALVFAAVLGAVAIGLNAYQSNSVNTVALPAQASGAVESAKISCADGYEYYLTPVVQVDSEDGETVAPTTPSAPVTKPNPTQVCASSAQVNGLIQDDGGTKLFQYTTTGGTLQTNYPQTIASNQAAGLPADLASLIQPKVKLNQCPNPNNPPTATGNVICKYVLSGTTYTLQNPTTQSGPWTCRVTFYFSGGNPACWQKDTPLGGEVNDTPSAQITASVAPTACQAGTYNEASCQNSSYCLNSPTAAGCNGAPAPTISADAGLCKNGANPPDCTTCPSGTSEGVYDAGGGIYCQATSQQSPSAPGSTNSAPPGPNQEYFVQQGNQWCDQNGNCLPAGSTCTGDGANQNCQTPAGNSTNVCTNGASNGPLCTTCPSGTTMQNGICNPPNTNTQIPNGAGNTGGLGGGTQTGAGGGNNSALGGLTSFLSGLTKGLLSPCSSTQNTSIGGNGSTLVPVQTFNPTTGTYTTTYVQQSAPAASSPCGQTPYGVGNNGVACAAPPAAPQCAAGATAQPTSATGNGCVTGYQCVPTSSTFGQTPTPQISCSPQIADVGQSVSINYSCQNATGSSGEGFSTNNQLSGSATTTIATPPAGTNTANFGLTCNNNGQTASAQCSVQVTQPAIDLVADPQYVQSGETASIGWVTSGMQACVISSPSDLNFTEANANNTNVNGVAQTDAITQNTEFDLSCQTLGGQTKTASTVVSIGSATSSAQDVTVTSTADGEIVNHGGAMTITWSASNAPSGGAAAIWLIDLQSQQAIALIADAQPTSGTYTWNIPAANAACSTTSYAPCGTDLVAGDSYGIEVAMYTPSSAYIGPLASAPTNSTPPTYADFGYTTNVFTIGQ